MTARQKLSGSTSDPRNMEECKHNILCRCKESVEVVLLINDYEGKCRYLAAKSEADNYARELKREEEEIIRVPDTGFLTYTCDE